MENENLKYKVGANIAELRRQLSMTQAELAAKLNYSDKAVSKWERGESIPDVMTLMQIAKVFGISVDDLLGITGNLAGNEQVEQRIVRSKSRHSTILMLSSLLVWFIATTVYVILSSFGMEKSAVAFVYCIPVNAIVLLVLRSCWRDYKWNRVLVSVIVWGILLSIYVTLRVFTGENIWKIFLLGIMGEVAVLLWFRLLSLAEREGSHG
ncbi:MAG: helix-turn-helix transcriptional regulator [Oscillospiraceae bacterium]|nr:helix-turn-helix transcriptional regulator [Oscillospiraceae bacterium]